MAWETDQLKTHIHDADGSPARLRALFAALSSELGSDQASRLWWAAFAETDAAET